MYSGSLYQQDIWWYWILDNVSQKMLSGGEIMKELQIKCLIAKTEIAFFNKTFFLQLK